MNKAKKILAILLSAVMCLAALTACSKSPVESEPGKSGESATKGAGDTDVSSSKEVTINFWHHYSAQSAENDTLTKVLIPKFESENPGIKVNAVSHEWADLHNKILVSAQSGTLPDVARLDAAWIPEFQAADILTSLDEKTSDFKDVSQALLDSAMSTAKIGDHYYGLALNTNTKILFYNVKAFKDAGITPPQTMEEFINDTKKLSGTNENGQQIWGYDEPALAGWNLCPFIWSYGGDLLNPEQTKASGYINSEKTVAAVQMFAGLYKDKAITGWNSGDIPMTDGFGTGRYRMILEGPWKIAEMKGAYPDFEYATAPIPAGDGGSVSVLGGEDISLFNTSGNDAAKEAAWKFAKFMTGEFAQTEMAKCGQIPVNKTALESETVKNSDFAPFIEAIKTAKSRPTVACWSEIDSELSAAVTSVINGEKTAQEAMDQLAVKVDGLLAGK